MTRYRGPTPHMQVAITPRMALAYHESGHALVALCAGLTVDEINVTDRDGGKCFYERGSPAAGDTGQRVEWAAREMRILYAARETERWISPHEMFCRGRADRADLEQLMNAVAVLTGDENYAQEVATAARSEAARIVDLLWPLVKKLAKALNKRGRLGGFEIREILGLPPKARRPNEATPRPADIPRPPALPILAARIDGGFNLPRDFPSPDPGQCEAATREFQRKYGGRDYAF